MECPEEMRAAYEQRLETCTTYAELTQAMKDFGLYTPPPEPTAEWTVNDYRTKLYGMKPLLSPAGDRLPKEVGNDG